MQIQSEQDLERLIADHIAGAKTERDLLDEKRAEAYRFYRGGAIGNEKEGFSDFVSMDVYDALESSKAKLLASLAGTRKIVRFKPRDADDIEAAEVRNKLLEHIFWEVNPGYKLLHDGIHDGLISDTTAYRWGWEERQEVEQIPFEGDPLTFQAAQQQAAGNGFEFRPDTESSTDGHIVGEFVKITQTGDVKIKSVVPERVLFDTNATSVQDAVLIGEQARLTGSDLAEMGIAPEIIDGIGESDFDESTASIARNDKARGWNRTTLTADQQVYSVFDGWIKVDLDGDGISELYQILCDMKGQLLREMIPAKSVKMVVGSLLPIPHTMTGLAQADLVVGVQKATSMVKRQYIDHVSRVNMTQYAADFGLIRNPTDLIAGRIGGMIDVDLTETGGQMPIQPLPQAQMSPSTDLALSELKSEKETRSGVSRLAQGLNQDALSSQNADSLIERMTNASTARVMMSARHFAEMILKPLLAGVWETAATYDHKPLTININNEWRSISPVEIGTGSELKTEFAITDDEAIQQAQSLLLMHNTLAQTPGAAMLYPEKQQHATLSELGKLLGLTIATDMIQNPEAPGAAPAAPALQQQIMQLQQGQQMAQMQLQQAQTAIAQLQQLNGDLTAKVRAKDQELALKRGELVRKTEQEQQRIDLAIEAEEHKQRVELQELGLKDTE